MTLYNMITTLRSGTASGRTRFPQNEGTPTKALKGLREYKQGIRWSELFICVAKSMLTSVAEQ